MLSASQLPASVCMNPLRFLLASSSVTPAAQASSLQAADAQRDTHSRLPCALPEMELPCAASNARPCLFRVKYRRAGLHLLQAQVLRVGLAPGRHQHMVAALQAQCRVARKQGCRASHPLASCALADCHKHEHHCRTAALRPNAAHLDLWTNLLCAPQYAHSSPVSSQSHVRIEEQRQM